MSAYLNILCIGLADNYTTLKKRLLRMWGAAAVDQHDLSSITIQYTELRPWNRILIMQPCTERLC